MSLQKTKEKQPYESLPKVWAWDDDKSLGVVCYHISTNDKDDLKFKHRVIDMDDVFDWVRNIEPYKEPEMRDMTDWEIFEALKKEGCALKDMNGFITNMWSQYSQKQDMMITYDFGKTWHELKVENTNES